MTKGYLVFFLAVSVSAQTYGLLPGPPRAQFLDSSGRPLAGGCVFTYASGTSTLSPTWQDSNGAAANTNPVILDGGGRASIWLDTSLSYKIMLTSAPLSGACTTVNFGSTVWVVDGVTSTGGGPTGGLFPAGGSEGQVQYNLGGNLAGDAGLTWNHSALQLTVAAAGTYAAITSASDGTLFRASTITQNTALTKGGYLHLTPVTYNPYDSGTVCHDEFGNPVTQPLPLTGDTFDPKDAILWVSTSPLMPSDNSCGLPIGNDVLYGLNLNSYFLAMGGLATTNTAYNSIDSLLGGAHVKLGITAEQGLYLLNHASSATLNNPASGFGGFAHQAGSVYYYWDDTGGTWNTFDFAGGGGGGGSFLPLSGGTMTGPIQVTGSQDFGTVGSPWHEGWFSLLNTAGAIQSQASGAAIGFQVANGLGTPFQVDGNGNVSAFGDLNLTSPASFLKMNGIVIINGAGQIQSPATGAAIAFQTVNTNVQIDGNGNISSAAQVNLTGGAASSYKMGGNVVIDNLRNATVNNLTITGTCSGCPGAGSGTYLPIAGGTMTGAIQVTGSQDFGTHLAPWHEGWFHLIDAYDAIQSEATGSAIAFQVLNGLGTPFQVDGNGNISGFGSLNLTSAGSFLKMNGVVLINAAGSIQSPITGSSIAFQTVGTTFQVDGNGNVSSFGQVNLTGGSLSSYKMGGTVVIDNLRNATVNNLTITGTCTGCTGSGGLPLTGGTMTGPIQVSGSQDFGTALSPWHEGWFSLLNTAGAIQSQASGAAIAFQVANGTGTPFQVDGNGNVSAAGTIRSTGNVVAGSSFIMGAQPVINSVAQFVGAGIDIAGNISAGGNLNLHGLGSVLQIAGNTVINSAGAFLGSGINIGVGAITAGTINLGTGSITANSYSISPSVHGVTYLINIPGMSSSPPGCSSGLLFTAGLLTGCF